MKILIILDVNLGSRICFKIDIYIFYNLFNNVYKFHDNRSVSYQDTRHYSCNITQYYKLVTNHNHRVMNDSNQKMQVIGVH